MKIGNPSDKVLLLGAGLTRNYGGYLASQVNNHLLVDPHLKGYPEVLDLVRNEFNFERALVVARKQFSPEEATALEEAIRRVFYAMNRTVVDYLNPYYQKFGGNWAVKSFLKKFSYGPGDSTFIFTLNQDLLMESWHGENIAVAGRAICHPGVELAPGPQRSNNWWWGHRPPTDEDLGQTVEILDEEDTVSASDTSRRINYVKLHGSIDWRNRKGNLVVMGGEKEELIRQSPLLSSYRDLFSNVLNRRGMRLFVIGYGFGDGHVNSVIRDACLSGLQLWVWDTIARQDWVQKLSNGNTSPNCEGIVRQSHYLDEPLHDVLFGSNSSQQSFHPIVDAFFAS